MANDPDPNQTEEQPIADPMNDDQTRGRSDDDEQFEDIDEVDHGEGVEDADLE
jgi:hypothetical protein